jgi:hypothetical protein
MAGATEGRVLIAFSDTPKEPDPFWSAIDQGGDFPQNFLAYYETQSGRSGLLAQTDTGEATAYINDHINGLFDPRNETSTYYDALDGRQIMFQLRNAYTDTWEPQWRGWIDFIRYDVDGSGIDQNGDPINVAVAIECVDVFDKLAGFGLTPGLDGVSPPTGGEDGVWYAETTGTADDRLIEIAADVGIDPTRYHFTSLNVKLQAVKYDADESALVAMRDAVDAELPFIANLYCDRRGVLNARGRYSRFYPDDVAAEPGSDWDFTRWAVGDGKAIEADATRAQMRVLSYTRGRQDIINVAVAYPQGIKPIDMPAQVFADVAVGGSIDKYDRHNAPPMSDLLTLEGVESPTPFTANQETAKFAELLVKNKKSPHIAISSLQVKTVEPNDPRAEATWAILTQSDISHIVNARVGYPGGTGFVGDSPKDDHYIEGRHLTVRPLQPDYDDVELELETTPFEWSADVHGVFPNPFA